MSGKAVPGADAARVPLTSPAAGMRGAEGRTWRMGAESHEKIRHSQREDEQVGGSVELLEVRDGDDHQQVQKHSDHRNT
ncbi:hypothetical protein AOLI_G00231250 [Acnodon oligacanthus]